MKNNITVVLGTARPGRVSKHVAKSLEKAFKEAGSQATLADVKDHVDKAVTVPPWADGGADAIATAWKEIVEDTDTFIFVLPEYNHSYPGEWKLLMDSLYKEYSGKKAYVATVSAGTFSGVRVMEHVLPVLDAFGFVLGKKRLHVGKVTNIFNEKGTLIDEVFRKRLTEFVDSVLENA